ncbi:MAG: hypothetical protein QOC96_408 [Acidobacteriota bacterium]|jgi:hypothetical protein|nr:hypothetical protein [Acidobacteriota bacterium]
MRIKFESSREDHIYAYERMVARSNAARAWRRQAAIGTAVLTGLILGIFVGIFIFIITGGSIAASLLYAAIIALPSAIIALAFHPNIIKRRLEIYYREKFGERTSFPVEIELTETGICTRQLDAQIIFEWPNIEDIKETEDRLEIYTRGGGGVFIKKNDFSSKDEYHQFMNVAQQYLNASRTSSNWLHAG